MSAIPQQVFATQKASLDNLLAVQGAFFDGFEKLVDLNLKAMKASLDDAAEKSQQAIKLKDAQEAVAFVASLVQPNAEKNLSYSKRVYDIISAVQGNLSRLSEEQVNEAQKQLAEAVEQYSKNAPTGSESAVALLKSTLATANNAYESISKAAKQATQAAESNLQAATSATLQAAEAASKSASAASRRAA